MMIHWFNPKVIQLVCKYSKAYIPNDHALIFPLLMNFDHG